MKTFAEKMIRPTTAWQQMTANAFHASMAQAGRDGARELEIQRAKENGVSNPIFVGALGKPNRNRGTAWFKAEYDRLPAATKIKIRGFDNFLAQRRAGLITSEGQPTG